MDHKNLIFYQFSKVANLHQMFSRFKAQLVKVIILFRNFEFKVPLNVILFRNDGNCLALKPWIYG